MSMSTQSLSYQCHQATTRAFRVKINQIYVKALLTASCSAIPTTVNFSLVQAALAQGLAMVLNVRR
jgi:hypothetical protein